MGWLFVIALFIGLPLLGWFLFTGFFDTVTGFGTNEEKSSKYIDRSVHHHYHDNRQVHLDGESFKSIDNDKFTVNGDKAPTDI